MQRILLLDNYDSFTFNLVHYLTNLGVSVDVIRNDQLNGDLSVYDKVVLSPGPGLPANAGGMPELIQQCDGEIPLLGVCLGMQGMGEYLGGELYNQTEVKHGVKEVVNLKACQMFEGIPKTVSVGLYHSWALKEVPGDFHVTAYSRSNIVMAIENVERKMYGVQFHPESIMTEFGLEMLKNFLAL